MVEVSIVMVLVECDGARYGFWFLSSLYKRPRVRVQTLLSCAVDSELKARNRQPLTTVGLRFGRNATDPTIRLRNNYRRAGGLCKLKIRVRSITSRNTRTSLSGRWCFRYLY